MQVLLILTLGLAAVSAVPVRQNRIVGGSLTTIAQYPFQVALLRAWTATTIRQACGAAILNNRSVLSAAHCFTGQAASTWRMRVGSTNANSGGIVHNTNRIVNHPAFTRATLDSDVAVLRSASTFNFNNNVRAGRIAGANYNLGDNQPVWAIGWGATSYRGPASEQLRQVQVWAVNQNTCRNRYAEIRNTVTANMLCAGWLDVGGRDTCQGDSGGPLLHSGVVVGVTSWGHECARPRFPGVYARVSRFTAWIQNNA